MKAFHTIAVPHRDILEGRLTMDVFAADLWEAYHGRGEEEYRDPGMFFHKTYLTKGLKNLLEIIQKRLEGKGGDPVIQIQTPFGGGKTHSLIALMHKSREWGVRCVVIVGTNLSAEQTLWGIMEEQLEGKVESMASLTSPGKENIKRLLEKHKPVLILIDELVEYAVKAGGIKVAESTLAAQTLAFMQELSETVTSMDNVALVVTLPSSLLEQYDPNAEKMLQQMSKVLGRLEKIYTPVAEQEIARVIRKRLFSSINQEKANIVVNEFIDYAAKEKILPIGMEISEYRNRFLDSYPFLPEVVDVLYHRWGSIATFQRTRGVLRILSLVVHNLKEKQLPYISLADFDLSTLEIRQELIKHIGDIFNSVVGQDITDADSGSKKVDSSLGDAYSGLKIGTRAATAIFMYSFSGGSENGATEAEIKRNATILGNPAAVVSEAIDLLKSKLFFLQFRNEKYFISNKGNLNRILLNKIENISESQVEEKEKELIKSLISSKYFETYVWEEKAEKIPDTTKLKLIILRQENEEVIKEIIRRKGIEPRVNCNTLIFLCPIESEQFGLVESIKRVLAYRSLLNDRNIEMTNEEKKEYEKKLNQEEKTSSEMVLRAYQCVIYPSKDADKIYEKECIGPPKGENKSLDERVFEKLKGNKILEKISPIVIKEKFLKNKEYLNTTSLLNTFYTTPGEPMILNEQVVIEAIKEGVKQKIFQVGEVVVEGNETKFEPKKPEEATFEEDEIILITKEGQQQPSTPPTQPKPTPEQPPSPTSRMTYIFELAKGKFSDIMNMITNLDKSIVKLEMKIEGEFTEEEITLIKETFDQLRIEYKEKPSNESLLI